VHVPIIELHEKVAPLQGNNIHVFNEYQGLNVDYDFLLSRVDEKDKTIQVLQYCNQGLACEISKLKIPLKKYDDKLID